MRKVNFSHVIGLALTMACLTVSLDAAAQFTLSKYEIGVVLRDAAIDPASGVVYMSAYDVNEVRKIDLRSGSIVGTATVEEGPTALALSRDGKTLACVNRIANSLTIVNTGDMLGVGTVPGKGSTDDVSALRGGGFAVANGFGDSVTLIDPAQPETPTVLEGVSSVPSGVAATETFLGVTTRTPAELLLYRGGSQTPVARVPVPASPQAVHAMTGNRFVVAARSGVVLIDADAGKVIARRDMLVHDVAVSGDRISILGDGIVEICDASLASTDRVAVSDACRSIAAADGVLVALAPKERAWYVAGAVAAPRPVLAAASPPAPELEPALPSDPERAPVPNNEMAASPTSTVQPFVVEAQPATRKTESATKETTERSAPKARSAEPKDKAQKAQSPSMTDAAPPRKSRIRGSQPVVAQEPSERDASEKLRRPAASVLETVGREPSTGESVGEGLDLGTRAGGFEPPDWTQPLKNVSGDNIENLDEGNIWLVTGNARLTLDTIHFAADRLFYDQRTGQLEATGDVEVVQGDSSAWADSVYYTAVPLGAQLQATPPLMPSEGDTEQALARKLLTFGKLDATNIEIVEPTRQFKADRVIYDFATETGEAYGVEGQAGQVRFGADRVVMEGEKDVRGENLWLTTCDCDHEYYRIRMKNANMGTGRAMTGNSARLELGGVGTPLWWPRWTYKGGEAPTTGLDFDSGHKAELGYYVNVGQQFAVTPNLELGLRFFPTTKEGVGFGLEGQWDLMESPAHPLYRGKGDFRSLLTTDSRGYYEIFHRQELLPDTIMLAKLEQWSDREFYKDFYYDLYKDRTQPRNFVNVTHTKPRYIATATARKTTNEFVSETERMPEVTYHLLERPLIDRLYVTFDSVSGYNEREPEGENALRSINVGRLSYDIELGQALNLTPFVDLEGSWYGKTRDGEDSDTRVSTTLGATLQTRFQRIYPGKWGFSGFKHIVAPSMTYSYRPEPTMGVEETPRFDAYDNVYGRSRLESKIDNIVMGRDEATGEAWQVARLSLYYGDDFANEIRKSRDYEVELDLRPRPLWGFQAIAEHHSINNEEDIDLDNPFIVQRGLIEFYERLSGRSFDPETADKYNTAYGDYDRLLAFVYYDDRNYEGKVNGRIGFAYTKTQDEVFNREILYGMGYKFSEKWAVAFEHRYDFERGELYRQRYEVRRVLQCLEGAVQLTERESGWDVGVEFSLTGIPGTRLRF